MQAIATNEQTKEKSFKFIVSRSEKNSYAAPLELFEDSIDLAKSECISKEYQNKISDFEVLGTLIAKYAKWDLSNLGPIFEAALIDANFKKEDLINYLKGESI